ncbi:MAG: pyruvate kinase, partial [Verrucomicrobiales bacterium]|nr:pyruvate kinase [Verrucomicrobiales bacterium]
MRRKTKIIATLGPATQSAEAVRNLILAGANIFRLNMSHAPHDWARELVGTIRTVASELDANVATLIDLQGPSIRTGDVAEKLVLTQGDLLEFRNAGLEPALPLSVTTNYDKLHEDVAVDKVMLVDNGEIHVRILRIEEGRLTWTLT